MDHFSIISVRCLCKVLVCHAQQLIVCNQWGNVRNSYLTHIQKIPLIPESMMCIFVVFMVSRVCQNCLNPFERHQNSLNSARKKPRYRFSDIRIPIQLVNHGSLHPVIHAKHQGQRECSLSQGRQHPTIQIKETLTLDLLKRRSYCRAMKHLSKNYLVYRVCDCYLK